MNIKRINIIEFRTRTEPPTKEGWYYSQLRPNGQNFAIEPVWVFARDLFPAELRVIWWGKVRKLSDFDWFGPVAEIREG